MYTSVLSVKVETAFAAKAATSNDAAAVFVSAEWASAVAAHVIVYFAVTSGSAASDTRVSSTMTSAPFVSSSTVSAQRKKPPSPPLYAWESRTAPGAPRVQSIETHAGTFEATATPGLYAAADIDDDDAARAYVDVQVILTRTEAAEVRALQRRAAKASPPRDTAFMHSSTPYVAPRPVSYRPEAKGLPRWNV